MRNNIEIREDFKNLIPPLSEAELDQLHRSLCADGCRDPLVVWKNKNILLDGHNRYAYCTANGIPFEVKEVSARNENSAKNFIILNQLGRRNVSPDVAALLRGKLYMGRKNDKKANLKQNASKGNTCPSVNTAEQVAKETGVSPRTVKNDAKFAEAVDYLGIEKDVMNGAEKRTTQAVVKAAEEVKIALGEKKRPPTKPKAQSEKTHAWVGVVNAWKRLAIADRMEAYERIERLWNNRK